MIIGIIGLGVVGSAIKYGFEKLGHTIVFHDIAYNTKIEDVLTSEICFICVPTPAKENGACDVSVVVSTVDQLNIHSYNGIVVIKSTIIPGTTVELQEIYPNLLICFVPEFLRERCAISDFMENHDVCIVGAHHEREFDIIKKAHGRYPKKFIHLTPTEAEFCKYFNNTFNATLVTFANSFYELCKVMKVDYTVIKEAMVNREHITDLYLDCNENTRGFGGACLNKDTKAVNYLCKASGINVYFFDMLIKENNKYITTVFEGMRKE